MKTIWQYTLVRWRGQIIGWGLVLAALALIVAPLYDTAVQMRAQLEDLLATLPPQFRAFIGSLDVMFSPAGYLDARYFMFLPLIMGVFAAIMGSGLIAGDEELGTLDLVLAHPIRRVEFFIGRWLAFVTAVFGILLIAWLGLLFGSSLSSLKLTGLQALRPFASLFAVTVWFGSLALMLSLILPSRRLAASLGSLIVAASFFLTILSSLSPGLADVAAWSPLAAYQGGKAITAFDVDKFLGLAVISIGFAAIGLWLFQRRDIRLVGERSWRWPPGLRRSP